MNAKLVLLIAFLSWLIVNYLAWFKSWKVVVSRREWYKSLNFYLFVILYIISMDFLIKAKDKLIENSTVNVIISIILFLVYIATIFYLEKTNKRKHGRIAA